MKRPMPENITQIDRWEYAKRLIESRRRTGKKGQVIIHIDDKGNVPKVESNEII